MLATTVKGKFQFSKSNLNLLWKHLIRKRFWLLAALFIGAVIGYYKAKQVEPKYTATINFVLSFDKKSSSISGLASQMGLNMGDESDDVFSGDNILEFFKSRSLIGKALISVTDTLKNELLINLIARKHFALKLKEVGLFGSDASKYSSSQAFLQREIITFVSKNFVVYKKDKKLVFYLIETTDTDPEIAYYFSKNMLAQASKFFIETKTKTSRGNVRLMEGLTDSISQVILELSESSASLYDRTYNINPSKLVQRSGSLFIQTKATALSQGYQQLLHALESAKMTLEMQTPLYQIIDMPELPLVAVEPNFLIYITISAFLGFFLTLILIALNYFWLNKINNT